MESHSAVQAGSTLVQRRKILAAMQEQLQAVTAPCCCQQLLQQGVQMGLFGILWQIDGNMLLLSPTFPKGGNGGLFLLPAPFTRAKDGGRLRIGGRSRQ